MTSGKGIDRNRKKNEMDTNSATRANDTRAQTFLDSYRKEQICEVEEAVKETPHSQIHLALPLKGPK